MSSLAKPIEVQSYFNLTVPGQNLDKNNIVFTVKYLIHSFLEANGFLIEKKDGKGGRPIVYTAEELLGLLVLGTLNNKNSCRALDDWGKNNDETYNYITNKKRPKKSTINLFFNENLVLISSFFRYLIQFGEKHGLIGFNTISIDGTILKAFASLRKVIRIEELEYLKDTISNFHEYENGEKLHIQIFKYFKENQLDSGNERIVSEIKKNLKKEGLKLLLIALESPNNRIPIFDLIQLLKQNYDGKHTISTTDPEARWMKNKKGNKEISYNLQTAIDDKYDFIVAMDVVNEPTDHHQSIPMINNVQMNLSKDPNFYLLDNGFFTTEALYYLYYNNINAIIPDRNSSSQAKIKYKDKNKEKNPYKKAYFEYKWGIDIYICPNNKKLSYQKDRTMNGETYRVYSSTECKNCKSLKKCTKSNKREIIDSTNPAKVKMRDDFHSDEGKKAYGKRAHSGEVIYANMIVNRNFPGIKRKSIKKVKGELTLHAIVHNIKKIHKYLIENNIL